MLGDEGSSGVGGAPDGKTVFCRWFVCLVNPSTLLSVEANGSHHACRLSPAMFWGAPKPPYHYYPKSEITFRGLTWMGGYMYLSLQKVEARRRG